MNRELYDNVRWLIGAIAKGLAARQDGGIGEVLDRMAEQNISVGAFQEPEPAGLPALRHLPQCIGECLLLDPDLAAAIAAVEDSFRWQQSKAYSDAVLEAGFIDNYGWAEIIGPNGFFAGDDFLLGLLILGPGRHYRDHFHPAPELYWPLTAGSLWSRNGGAFVEQPQGATIWHPPMTLHATKTAASPMLAAWSWTGDTATPARLA